MGIVKILKIAAGVVVAILALMIFTGNASEAADITKAIGGGIWEGLMNVKTFFIELFN